MIADQSVRYRPRLINVGRIYSFHKIYLLNYSISQARRSKHEPIEGDHDILYWL